MLPKSEDVSMRLFRNSTKLIDDVIRYNKVVMQRNRALKDMGEKEERLQ